MNIREFEKEYRREVDEIHASDSLRENVRNLKKTRRTVSPVKSGLLTVVAAVMIFTVAHDYDFENKNNGVIEEAKTQIVTSELPEAEFGAGNSKESNTTTKKASADVKAVEEPKTASVNTDDSVAYTEGEETSAYVPERTRMVEEEILQMWSMEEYSEYLGKNIDECICNACDGERIGDDSVAVKIGENEEVIDDTGVFNYAVGDMGAVEVKASKSSIFDASLSGNIEAGESGIRAYKVAGGVYYDVYATGVSEEIVVTIMNCL